MGIGFEEAGRLTLREYQLLLSEHNIRANEMQKDVSDEEWEAFNERLSGLPGVKSDDEEDQDGRHGR